MKKIISILVSVLISSCSIPSNINETFFSIVSISSTDIPQDKIILKDTFKVENKKREWKKEFLIKDTTKRYTIAVIKSDQNSKIGRININGSNYVREIDFKAGLTEISKDFLLLNTKNSLLVRLNGKVGSSVTVIIYEGGMAGTIKRRNWQLGKASNHDARVKVGDYNIYFPNDPNSLGDLEAYKGIATKETQQKNVKPIESSGVTDIDGNNYFPYSTGKVISYYSDGNIRWEFDTQDSIQSSISMDSSKNIFVPTKNGEIFSIDENGYERWRFTLPEPDIYSFSSPAIDENGSIFTGSVKGNFRSIDNNGQEIWNFQTRASLFGSPVIDQDRIYIQAQDQTIYSIRKSTGEQVWEFQTGKAMYNQIPAIMSNGNVVFGSMDKEFFCLNKNGFEQWQVKTDGALSVSAVIDQVNNVYFATQEGTLYAVSAFGDELWNYKTEGKVIISPIIDTNNNIYIADNQGYIYSFSKDGKLNFKTKVNDSILSPLSLTKTGLLIVSDVNRKNHIFETGSQGYQKNAWSKVHANENNTGRRVYE